MLDKENFNQYHFLLLEYSGYHQTVFADGCPRHYFAKMLSGSAVIQTEKQTLKLRPGDFFYIPKGLVYQSFWTPDAESSLSLYSFGCDSLPLQDSIRYKLQKFECDPISDELFEQLTADLQVSFRSIALLFHFISRISESLGRTFHPQNSTALTAALDYMNQNTAYTVGDIAAHCGLSESGLYYLFRTQLGKTPVGVKNEILTAKATELLRSTDLPIEEIASRLSFSSSSYFRTMLHKTTGKTPSQIRREAQL